MRRMSNWSRKLPSPIFVEGSKVEIATLAQARDYMLGLHHQYTDQACWQRAAAELIEAAKSGNTNAAAEAFHRALVITLLLWKEPWAKPKRS